ncbi:hypothetical protein C8R47DRAFT_380018 [Mycena vitilis]|nr:hypothetical protein C8R47DRAFT_380018 [Mycena vitilis]
MIIASSSAAPPRPTLHGFVSAPIPPIVPGWVAPLDKYGSTRTPVVTTASSSPAPSKPTQPGFGASPIPPFMCTPSIPTGSSSAPSFVSAPCPPSVSVSAPGVCLALKPTEPPPRLSDAAQALRDEYKHANFDMMCKRGAISGWEWGVLCLEYHCPGRLYTPCEGETMEKFRVHLLNYHVANYPSTPTAESAPPVVPAAPPPTAFSPAASSLVSYPTFSPSTVPARAPGLSSPMGVLSDPASHLEETVVNWIRNTPNATTTAFTRYFALYMTDVGNRNKLFDVVRKVAQARKVADTAEGIQGILWLKEAYQGPQVM